MFSRLGRFSFSILLTLAFLTVPLVSTFAQDGAGPTTTTFDMSFGFTGTAFAGNVSQTVAGDFGAAPTTFFVLDTAGGAGGQFTLSCAPAGPGDPGGDVVELVWVTPPVLEYPATFTGNATATFGLASQGGISTRVDASLEFAYASDSENRHVHNLGQADFAYAGPASGGALPASMNFVLDWGGNPVTVPANAYLNFALFVSCGAGPDITLSFPSLPPVPYVYGSPGDPDNDGDGIPDALDPDDDNDGFDDVNETAVGSDPRSVSSTPDTDGDGDGFSIAQESAAGTSDSDANDFPGAGGFPVGLLILIIIVVLVLVGLAGAGYVMLAKGVTMTISDDGFQSLAKGEKATYALHLTSSAKKEEVETPVLLSLKGVPEDWTATLSPDQVVLKGGEEPEAVEVTFTVIPPAEAEYEEEAQITVAATPTDEEGNTSALKPATSVKSKTIVNIGIAPPEGDGKKKPKKAKKPKDPKEEAGAADDDADAEAPKKSKKKLGGLKLGKKGKKDKAEDAEAADASAGDAKEPAAADAPAGDGKPKLAMGKMSHEPADFSAGDEVTTTVTVSNKGDGDVQGLRLNLFVNDKKLDTQVVDLVAGDKTTVTFNWTALPDENRIRLKGEVPKRG